jgi:flavin-dependent dehydrogenase
MTDADLLPPGSAARNGFWRKCLEHAPHTMSRLGPASSGTSLRIVPACSSSLQFVTGPAWLAVGDAAMSFDPLSARGVTWALESGLAAARAHDSFLAGKTAPTQDFAYRSALDFSCYLREREAIYNQEHRWPDSPFWNRRQPRP